MRPPPPSSSGCRRVAVVAGGLACGVLRLGLALLLALAAPVSVVEQGGRRSKGVASGAAGRARGTETGVAAGIAAVAARRTGAGGAGRGVGSGAGASRVNGRDGPGKFFWAETQAREGASERDGRPAYNMSDINIL
jgi:hypothetical protein